MTSWSNLLCQEKVCSLITAKDLSALLVEHHGATRARHCAGRVTTAYRAVRTVSRLCLDTLPDGRSAFSRESTAVAPITGFILHPTAQHLLGGAGDVGRMMNLQTASIRMICFSPQSEGNRNAQPMEYRPCVSPLEQFRCSSQRFRVSG